MRPGLFVSTIAGALALGLAATAATAMPANGGVALKAGTQAASPVTPVWNQRYRYYPRRHGYHYRPYRNSYSYNPYRYRSYNPYRYYGRGYDGGSYCPPQYRSRDYYDY